MSTRATYNFRNISEYSLINEITLYIHYDGYPEGAAWYFYDTLLYRLAHPECKGFGPEEMIRTVENARITKNHNYHGDTEYQYDIVVNEIFELQSNVTAYKVIYIKKGERKTELFFTGNVEDFIRKYNKELGHNLATNKKLSS